VEELWGADMVMGKYWGADSLSYLVRSAFRYISFEGSLFIYIYIYINSKINPPIIIIYRIYDHKNLLSL